MTIVESSTKIEIDKIKDIFLSKYSNSVSELNYKNLYELIVSVMLSAQCTDKRVNIITPNIFKNYPDIKALSTASLDDIKRYINSCSFFNNKAKNLIKMAQKVMEDFEGEIPLTQKELMSLAGVGQKTANVVRIEYLKENVMAVDTHVFRVAHRLGLTNQTTATKVEEELTKKFKTELHTLHQAMVLFGRYTCKAINPDCENCFMDSYCKSKDRFKV